MNETRRDVLRAICDTVCPAIERADDPDGFWARRGSEVGAPEALAETIEAMPPAQRGGLEQLLDGLDRMGFLRASRRSREQILRNLEALGPEAAAGGGALMALGAVPLLRPARPAVGAQPVLADLRLPGSQRHPAAG
jgi:hypothetical protein